MKKIIAIVVITCLCFCLMLGCNDKKDKSNVTPKPSVTTSQNNNKPNQNNSNNQSNQNNNNNNQSNQNNNNQSNSNSSVSQNQNTPSSNNSSSRQSSYNIIQIYNETGTDIYSLYSVTSNSSNWGNNILDGAIFYSGNEFDIKVPTDSNSHWDLMVVDYEGTTVTWTDLDLTSISQIDLYVDQTTGQIMADWK